ncbi:hypothetical protein ACLOJK_010224 [Asimina triloba]
MGNLAMDGLGSSDISNRDPRVCRDNRTPAVTSRGRNGKRAPLPSREKLEGQRSGVASSSRPRKRARGRELVKGKVGSCAISALCCSALYPTVSHLTSTETLQLSYTEIVYFHNTCVDFRVWLAGSIVSRSKSFVSVKKSRFSEICQQSRLWYDGSAGLRPVVKKNHLEAKTGKRHSSGVLDDLLIVRHHIFSFSTTQVQESCVAKVEDQLFLGRFGRNIPTIL